MPAAPSQAVAGRMPSDPSRGDGGQSRTLVIRGRTVSPGCPPNRADGGQMGLEVGTLSRATPQVWAAIGPMGRSTGSAVGTAGRQKTTPHHGARASTELATSWPEAAPTRRADGLTGAVVATANPWKTTSPQVADRRTGTSTGLADTASPRQTTLRAGGRTATSMESTVGTAGLRQPMPR
ncbi:hypothetical protein ACFPN7_36870 [Amycolatopsis halotolerans]|uniref:hypothetical protein n=1 Tax=Amycolatopsis halotolerans TaxID=330083 RepID=UPI00360DC5C4